MFRDFLRYKVVSPFKFIRSNLNHSFHSNRTTLLTDTCSDPFWTSCEGSCHTTFGTVGKRNWHVWNCNVTPQRHSRITAGCRTPSELCAFQFVAGDQQPLHCTMHITIILLLNGFVIRTLVTVAVVCCCCIEGAPCRSKRPGSGTAVTYGPVRFPAEVDTDFFEVQRKATMSDEPSSEMGCDRDGGQALGENPYTSV
jgi:hypothetical protein